MHDNDTHAQHTCMTMIRNDAQHTCMTMIAETNLDDAIVVPPPLLHNLLRLKYEKERQAWEGRGGGGPLWDAHWLIATGEAVNATGRLESNGEPSGQLAEWMRTVCLHGALFKHHTRVRAGEQECQQDLVRMLVELVTSRFTSSPPKRKYAWP